MATKPFNLRSPEKIAAEYGGNKQKIASATQLGLVDPTAALLAGMFIDRMRSAQTQEQNPQQTVAQHVFAPPQGMPPQGAPPQGMPPQGAPPAMMAEGGLASLPIPDTMFDEPANDGYAGGGIVAFDDGGLTSPPDGNTPPAMDPNYGQDVRRYFDINNKMLGDAQGPAMRDLIAENTKIRSPEAVAAQKKQDMWATLAQVGATMASTPGSFLQGVGAGIGKAIPGALEQDKERKAEQRAALQSSATMETAQYSARAAAMQNAQKMFADAQTLREKGKDREASVLEAKARREVDYAQIASNERNANLNATVQREGFNRLTGDERMLDTYRKATPADRLIIDKYKAAAGFPRLENSNFSTDMDDARKAVDASRVGRLKNTNKPAYDQAVNAEYTRINQARAAALGGAAGAGGSGGVEVAWPTPKPK